jgi:hypothetical protein
MKESQSKHPSHVSRTGLEENNDEASAFPPSRDAVMQEGKTFEIRNEMMNTSADIPPDGFKDEENGLREQAFVDENASDSLVDALRMKPIRPSFRRGLQEEEEETSAMALPCSDLSNAVDACPEDDDSGFEWKTVVDEPVVHDAIEEEVRQQVHSEMRDEL